MLAACFPGAVDNAIMARMMFAEYFPTVKIGPTPQTFLPNIARTPTETGAKDQVENTSTSSLASGN